MIVGGDGRVHLPNHKAAGGEGRPAAETDSADRGPPQRHHPIWDSTFTVFGHSTFDGFSIRV